MFTINRKHSKKNLKRDLKIAILAGQELGKMLNEVLKQNHELTKKLSLEKKMDAFDATLKPKPKKRLAPVDNSLAKKTSTAKATVKKAAPKKTAVKKGESKARWV